MSQQAYTKPIFTEQEIEKFEKIIDSQIYHNYLYFAREKENIFLFQN